MDGQDNQIIFNINDIKRIQLEVLDAIHLFCNANSIRYSLACGTMLGAVRHKGYIPWDDDIDIYLLREDYKKLVKLFPIEYKGRFELISLERNMNWDKPYAKAFDNRTLFFENGRMSPSIGVNIDVYPIDDVPDSFNKWIIYNKRRRVLQRFYSISRMRIDPERFWLKNLLLFIIKIPLRLINQRRFAILLSKFAQKHDNKGYHFVFECVQGLLQKNRFKKSIFDNLCEYKFEDSLFCGFVNYDEYLKNGYGNYWALPPEEKRVSHHKYEAKWKERPVFSE